MRTLDAKLGRIPGVPDVVDPMLERAGRLGDEHELRHLERLKQTRQVVEFARPAISELAAAASVTHDALLAGADVLFQATFFDGRFVGFADFLVRSDPAHTDAGEYEVWDTKLARTGKVTALLQVAAYGDQLLRLGVPVASDVHLLLGDGRTSSHRLADIFPVYRKRRARLQQMIDRRYAEMTTTAWGDPRYSACGRCPACSEQVDLHRDVLLVAGMRLTQRKRLADAGVCTIEQLATAQPAGPATSTAGIPATFIPGITDTTLANLRAQARLQLKTPSGDHPVPAVEVYNPSALGALPAKDDGDIFFDFEGDPLYSEDGGPEWGLDYLFGLIDTDERFIAFWAHDYAEERQALIDFLAWVGERRARHPSMHIYHYAAYERIHLLSIAARHGVGEEEVDELLRADVLVDLYPIVKKSLRVGSRSYSIKKLEPLYMGDSVRDGVDNAVDSITEYAESRILFHSGQTDAAQAKLDAIGDYNNYDCVSTLRLRDWLLGHADVHGVAPSPVDEELKGIVAASSLLREPSPVYVALAAAVAGVPVLERTADQTAIALASAAIDYHRREGKKFWQEHFDRLRNPVDSWADTRDVLIVSSARVVRDWERVGKAHTLSRDLVVTGEVAPGSSFKAGDRRYLVYDEPYPPIDSHSGPGSRYAHERAIITDVVDGVYFVTERLKLDADAYDQLPMALTPGTPPNPGTQVDAIAGWGQRVLAAFPAMLPDAALDVLRRQPPRGRTLPAGDGAASTQESIVADLLRLDHSYLAVQGPPGTGKTYIGSRVIRDLVEKHGWRVGVVGQSHSTVENMLDAVVAAGLDPARVGKRARKGDEAESVSWSGPIDGTVASFGEAGGGGGGGGDDGLSGGFVLGGTAWTFSNPNAVPPGSLDLLVIDEAGQFSLASTIASAVCATRLLLLGDPQQLPQVSQGSHPEPVDASALGWLSDGHDVLPEEFGYFLAKTWRMHPAVCLPVSLLSYEGRLDSQAASRNLEGIVPGLHPIAVNHSLNSTSSREEADRVVEIVQSVVGREWTDDTRVRLLGPDDVIVVAPYNAQVELIRQCLNDAGLSAVPVGTVDKFQGREAAVAVVSLAASSAEEVPRGLEFLLLANRLNVAISRAQWAAFLVYSPALTEYLPRNAATLAQLSAFIGLVEPEEVQEAVLAGRR